MEPKSCSQKKRRGAWAVDPDNGNMLILLSLSNKRGDFDDDASTICSRWVLRWIELLKDFFLISWAFSIIPLHVSAMIVVAVENSKVVLLHVSKPMFLWYVSSVLHVFYAIEYLYYLWLAIELILKFFWLFWQYLWYVSSVLLWVSYTLTYFNFLSVFSLTSKPMFAVNQFGIHVGKLSLNERISPLYLLQ